ncbi:hypothetical protein [Clostridium phage Saumur]|nr:hypothetical protein [Clostridium phage Saumur]
MNFIKKPPVIKIKEIGRFLIEKIARGGGTVNSY